MYSGLGSGCITVWKPELDSIPTTFPAHNQMVHDVSFSPNGQLLAAIGADDNLHIWSTNVSHFHVLVLLNLHQLWINVGHFCCFASRGRKSAFLKWRRKAQTDAKYRGIPPVSDWQQPRSLPKYFAEILSIFWTRTKLNELNFNVLSNQIIVVESIAGVDWYWTPWSTEASQQLPSERKWY